MEAPEPPSGGPPPTIPLPVRLLMKSPRGMRLLQLLIRCCPASAARRPVVILVPLLLLVLVIAIVVVIVQLVF